MEIPTLETLDARTKGTHSDLGKVEEQLAQLQADYKELRRQCDLTKEQITLSLKGSVALGKSVGGLIETVGSLIAWSQQIEKHLEVVPMDNGEFRSKT